MKTETRLVRFDAAPGDPARPSVTPLHQTATFVQEDPEHFAAYDYSRSGNPTRTVLERQLATLEGAAHALAFASGVTALHAVVGLVAPGGSVLAGDELYGGTVRLLERHAAARGLRVAYGDPARPQTFARALDAATRLVLVETPTNPRLRIVDVAALAAALAARAGELGAPRPLIVVDNTMLTPYVQRPLALGADLVVHSATKALCGHGDVTAGVVATNDEALAGRLAFDRNAEGTALAPFEAWLLLRGLKTLAVRLDRQQASAARLAAALVRHPALAAVHFPGLPDHPGAATHARQARGPGVLVSLELAAGLEPARVIERLELFPLTVSFGSVGSSVCYPRGMSHASVPPALRDRLPPASLLRLSVGLEDPDDLIADVTRALDVQRKEPSSARSASSSVG